MAWTKSLVAGFSGAGLLAAQIVVGSIAQVSKAHPNDTHWEVVAAAHPTDASRLLASSFLYSDAGGAPQTIVYESKDGGKTWLSRLEGAPMNYTGDPALAYGPDGEAYYVASRVPPVGDRQMLLFRSADGGSKWTPPTIFTYTDRQYVVVDGTHGKYHGRLYVNGNNRIPKDVSDIVAFVSTDRGATFRGPGKRDGFGKFYAAEMGNAVVTSDGTLVAVIGEGNGPTRLKAIWSTNGGESFEPSVPISEFVAGGQRKAATHNNANALPMLAVDATALRFKDRLYVVWPDRASGHSDILFAWSADKGNTWSKAKCINDAGSAKLDHFMPTVAVNREGTVGVLWYDRRNHADNLGWDARFSASFDGGETFLPSVEVSDRTSSMNSEGRLTGLRTSSAASPTGSQTAQVTLSNFTFIGGDTAGLAADAKGVFHAVWVGNGGGTPQLWSVPIQAQAPASTGVDVTSRVKVDLSLPSFDRTTGLLTVECRLENTSKEALAGPFRIRATSWKSELGEIEALIGGQRSGAGAEWTVAASSLTAGQRSAPLRLQFRLTHPRPLSEGDRVRLGLLSMDVQVFGTKNP